MSDVLGAAPAAAPAPVSEANLEAGDEVEELADPAAPAPVTKAEEKKIEANKKKYNLKVNGKSRDVELDINDDAAVQKYLQKAMASDEKFQEAAMTRKQMEYLIDQLRTNPLAVLQHEALGLNVRELAQQVMERELDDLAKSPEQKRIEELENKLKSKEEREKQLEDEKREQEMARMESEAAQDLDEQITSAISQSSLPKSAYTVKRLADAMIEAVHMGYTDVTPEQIMPFVEEQIMEEIQRLFEASPDEVMEKLVSKKRLDGYRKARVTKGRVAPGQTLKQAVKDIGSGSNAPKKEQEPFRVKDLFKF